MAKKHVFCILLAAMFLISACQGNGGGNAKAPAITTETAASVNETTEASVSVAETTETVTSSTEKSKDWRTPYENTVKVTISNNDGSGAIFAEGEDINYNLWTKRWKEKYNIEVETIWASADYNVKINLAIASRELPDMFTCNSVQFQQLLDADLLYDITSVYEEYIYEDLQKIFDNDPLSFNCAWRDDKLYAIPQMHYGYNVADCIWYKTSWLNASGVSEINTLSQLEDLMRQWMDEYDQSYAMPLSRGLETFQWMAPTWRALRKIWIDDGSGGIMYGDIAPEVKDQLEVWARWYKEGLLRPDWATIDWDTMIADVIDGKVGVIPARNYTGWSFAADIYKLYGEEELLEPRDMPSIDGKPLYYPCPFLLSTYNVVSKKCANPEVLIKLNNDYVYVLIVSVKEGTMSEAEQLPFGEGNMHHVTGPFKLTYDTYQDVDEVWHAVNEGTKNPVFSTGYAYNYYNEIMKWVNDRDPLSLGRYLQMGCPTAPIYRANLVYDEGRLVFSKMWGPQPEILDELSGVLNDILNEGFTKIINGIEPLDYFETMVEEWKAAGGDEVTAAVNKMYGKK